MLKEIENRRAIRSFLSKEVEQEKIDEIVKAGLVAPSAKNIQDVKILVIKNKDIRNKLMRLNAKIMGIEDDRDPFYGAPVIILVFAEKSSFAGIDGGAAIENMLIEATHLGLATCWIHRAKEEFESIEGREILKDLNIDFDAHIGIGHIALGYADKPIIREKTIKDGRVFEL